MSVLRPAIAVGSARRWITGIDRQGQRCHVHHRATVHRVASVTRQTGARRGVIDDATCGTLTASTGAWIHALVVQTSFAAVAVSVGHALGPAGDIRVTKVLRQTRARSDAVSLVAHCVGATRRWIARCGVSYRCNRF